MPTNKTAVDALIQDIKTKDPKLHQILSSINRDLNVYKDAQEIKYVKSDKKFATVQDGLAASDSVASELRLHEHNSSAHHSPVTLGVNNNPALTLKDQVLTLSKELQGGGGTAGVGVPAGGTTGQILEKASNADYDTDWTDPTAGSGDKISITITQAGHGFAVGNAIYFTGAAWAKAKSDAATTLGIGVVSAVNGDDFTVCQAGYVSGLAGLTPGEYYFVSKTSAGDLTATEPDTYSNPILFALSATAGLVLPFRPSAVATTPGADTEVIYNKSGNLFADANLLWDYANQALKIPTGDILTRQPLNKNFIHNANFNIWQRGTSFATLAAGSAYTADRWLLGHSTDGTITVTQEAAVLPTVAQSGIKSVYSIKLTPPTADASIAAGQYCALSHKIEGFDVQKLMGKVVALSFWVRSSKTGTYCIAFRNAGVDRAYIVEYTVNVADTWEKKTVVFTMHDGTAGTWDFISGTGLFVSFILACGATFQTTPNAWQTGNFLGTANQVDWMDVNTATFYLSQVQLEIGGQATPFEFTSIADDLLRCQRYCFTVLSDVTLTTKIVGHGWATSTSAGIIFTPLPATMRAVPALTATAGDWQVSDGSGAAVACTGLSLTAAVQSQSMARIDFNTAAGAITQFRPYHLRAAVASGKLLVLSADL